MDVQIALVRPDEHHPHFSAEFIIGRVPLLNHITDDIGSRKAIGREQKDHFARYILFSSNQIAEGHRRGSRYRDGPFDERSSVLLWTVADLAKAGIPVVPDSGIKPPHVLVYIIRVYPICQIRTPSF